MECAPILEQVKTRNQDPEFKQYIQKSNGACNYASRVVCCPKDGSITQPPSEEPTTKNAGTSHLLTPEEGCGFSNVTHPKVVGGTPAKLGGWPWMALVGYRNDFGDVSFKCGGTLISSRHVLTAAHCIRKDLYSIRIGEHDLSTDAETQHIDIVVSKIITHPNYDKKDGHSDLAILVLEEPVTAYGFTIRPICLPIDDPARTRNFEGTMPFVAGWGRTQEGGKSANVLQEVQLPVLRNSDCQTRYKKQNRLISAKQFDNAILCAGVLTGGMDSCQGDSGGPLMAPIRVGKQFLYYQIGVVSYGIGCARADVPGVYTRVSHFVDWIKEQVATN
jgi:secreted trypsin-like serine protease